MLAGRAATKQQDDLSQQLKLNPPNKCRNLTPKGSKDRFIIDKRNSSPDSDPNNMLFSEVVLGSIHKHINLDCEASEPGTPSNPLARDSGSSECPTPMRRNPPMIKYEEEHHVDAI